MASASIIARRRPDLFERVELTPEDAEHDLLGPEDCSRVLAALHRDADSAPRKFFDYLDSRRVTEIYSYHGLDRESAPLSVATNAGGG